MRLTHSRQCLLAALALFLRVGLWAEQPIRTTPPGPKPPGTAPRPIIQSSGYAFAGTVKAVQHVRASKPNGIGTTKITFHVDHAIRGVRAGQTLIISEWAGLWSSGEQYRPGEHVLLFLYPPSKLGLTSPVRGREGRFKVGGGGRIVVRPEQRDDFPTEVSARFMENGEIEVAELARALRQARSEP